MGLAGVRVPRGREALEAERKKAEYWRLHAAGKTDQAKADLKRLEQVRKEREEAAKKKAAEKAGMGVLDRLPWAWAWARATAGAGAGHDGKGTGRGKGRGKGKCMGKGKGRGRGEGRGKGKGMRSRWWMGDAWSQLRRLLPRNALSATSRSGQRWRPSWRRVGKNRERPPPIPLAHANNKATNTTCCTHTRGHTEKKGAEIEKEGQDERARCEGARTLRWRENACRPWLMPTCVRGRFPPLVCVAAYMTLQSSFFSPPALLLLLLPPAPEPDDPTDDLEPPADVDELDVLAEELPAGRSGFLRLYFSRIWSCLLCISDRRFSAFFLRSASSAASCFCSASRSFFARCTWAHQVHREARTLE